MKTLSKELNKTPTVIEFSSFSGLSTRQINKFPYSDLCKKAGLKPNLNSKEFAPTVIKGRAPKILILDIETAPIKAYVYGTWDQNISPKQIEKDWWMISWAAKWVGKKKIMYQDSKKQRDNTNDKKICEGIYKLIDEADIIIGHNVDKFDMKKLNTRFLKHGMPPIGKKQTIDTLKIARRYFKITSNRLDFIAKFLDIKGKYVSKKYNGFDLWIACYNKNMEAYAENKKYNKQDVEITEAVFEKLKTWDQSLNFQSFYQATVCICGGNKFKKKGLSYTKSGIFQRFECLDCHTKMQSKQNILSAKDRKELKMK